MSVHEVSRNGGGPECRGKPTVRESVQVVCNRIDGDVTVLDITDLNTPKPMRKFKISGTPVLAFFGEGYIFMPAGRQGLMKFELPAPNPARK